MRPSRSARMAEERRAAASERTRELRFSAGLEVLVVMCVAGVCAVVVAALLDGEFGLMGFAGVPADGLEELDDDVELAAVFACFFVLPGLHAQAAFYEYFLPFDQDGCGVFGGFAEGGGVDVDGFLCGGAVRAFHGSVDDEVEDGDGGSFGGAECFGVLAEAAKEDDFVDVGHGLSEFFDGAVCGGGFAAGGEDFADEGVCGFVGVFGVLRVEFVVDEFVYFGDGDCACGGKLLRGDADALCELHIGGLGVCDFEAGTARAEGEAGDGVSGAEVFFDAFFYVVCKAFCEAGHAVEFGLFLGRPVEPVFEVGLGDFVDAVADGGAGVYGAAVAALVHAGVVACAGGVGGGDDGVDAVADDVLHVACYLEVLRHAAADEWLQDGGVDCFEFGVIVQQEEGEGDELPVFAGGFYLDASEFVVYAEGGFAVGRDVYGVCLAGVGVVEFPEAGFAEGLAGTAAEVGHLFFHEAAPGDGVCVFRVFRGCAVLHVAVHGGAVCGVCAGGWGGQAFLCEPGGGAEGEAVEAAGGGFAAAGVCGCGGFCGHNFNSR